MSKGPKRGPNFGQQIIQKLGFTLVVNFWTTCVILVSFWCAPWLHFGSPWLLLASFWELFGVFFVHFWRCMTCFWINSNPSGNREESTFGSLIMDIFFITFLESGRVDFPMVSFGRDMQKSAEISAKILQAEFCSDSVLQWFMPTLYTQSSAAFSVSFLHTALRGD